jgi:tRNA G18 (ribose-2'-O)-methylase SpoU
MPVIRIQQFDDPRLADYRSVSDSQLLLRRNRFIAEGRLVIERAIETGHRVESMLLNAASLRALEPLISRRMPELPIYVCEADGFAAITGFHLHRGCLALAERPRPRSLREVIEDARILLVLEGVTDADNVGSAFRNAAAFGANVILSDTCCDPLYRKAIRTSMAAVLHTPYVRINDLAGGLTTLTTEGFVIVALTPREDAVDLRRCARPQPNQRMALVVGSEGPGLTAEAEALAHIRVRIPITANVDSLNVATATGIALYYFTTNQQPATTDHQSHPS